MDEYSDGEIARQEKPIGYFSTLNSTFFSTDEEIKKNFNNLFEKYENGNKLIDKELLEKIYISYSVLEDGESRKGYLHMLEVRYFLSQPNNLENCVSKFVNRIFPFTAFEMSKKSKNSSKFKSRIYKFDFVTRTIMEFKRENLKKGYNFSAILNCCSGIKEDELVINILQNNIMASQFFKAKYHMQRDLIIQICLLARDVNEKRVSTLLSNSLLSECSKPAKIAQHRSKLKLIPNDKYIPPKSIFKSTVVERVSFGFNKKLNIIMGYSNILICKDNDANLLERIIPIEHTILSFCKTKENNSIILLIKEEKISLKFCNEKECLNFCELLSDALNNKLKIQETIISLPYLSKDALVANMKKEKLMKVIKKIEETTNLIEYLKIKKKKLEEEMLKEEESKEEIMDVPNENEIPGPVINAKSLERTRIRIKTIYSKANQLI